MTMAEASFSKEGHRWFTLMVPTEVSTEVSPISIIIIFKCWLDMD